MKPAPESLAIPFAESPLLDERALAALGERERELVRHFRERGYVVLDLELDDFDRLAHEVITTLAPRYPASDRRIDEAWYDCPAVRAIASAPKVIDALRLLYGREPFPFQTLNFDRGTQQPAHSDTIHFHCLPRYFMCGVWAALEDVDATNGPLFIYPKSHRLPDYTMSDLGLDAHGSAYGDYEQRIAAILDASGLQPEELHLRKGQAVIWAANAFHGGCAIRDPKRTRHSQATHYYFEDCLYYFPMGSEPFAGKVTVREAIDIRTGRFVPPRYCGRPYHLEDQPYLWSYARPLPAWVTGTNSGERDDDENLDVMKRRIRTLEETVSRLREDARNIQDDNRKKEALIQEIHSKLAYKVARRISKASRKLFGNHR